ncbi:MAG: universal stress protein [Magnetococcales bacterium]|nr:universal stress protein [Magnetococcales bacterium]
MQQLSPTDRFERILLATEGSEFSGGADAVALDLAGRFQAQLSILRMVFSNIEYDAIAPDRVAAAEEEALRQVRAVAQQAERLGLSHGTLVRRGMSPEEVILEAATETGTDLIVMGRRGQRRLARLRVGHATARVVGQATCKVLVVPRDSRMWQKEILLTTDGSRHGDAAAVAALRLARQGNLALAVLTVLRREYNQERRHQAEEAVKRIVSFAQNEGVVVNSLILEGDPPTVVVETAKQRGCDLIVGGSFGRTGFGNMLLGSVIERILGSAHCPVLTVRG